MNKKTILCVDDEKFILSSLKKELKPAFKDYNIEVAESGDEALEIIDSIYDEGNELPVVIADYIMPDMKGDQLLEKIHKKLPNTRNIMLTGLATTEGVTNAVNYANLYRYIAKPWDHYDLRMTVKEALKSYYLDVQLELRRKELEIANKSLLKLDTAKNYFLGLLSHELNTPLTGINGFASLIKSTTDDPDLIESCEMILESASRLRKFADVSMLITRLRTDKYDLDLQSSSISEIVDITLSILKDSINQKGLQIIKENISLESFIKLDPLLISKALEMIIDNAIKFSPQNGKLFIYGQQTDDCFILSVRDNGIGFTKESLENLFEFFTSDELMSHSEGMGLGLATAKIIMDQHNFNINVSNDETGGAKVEFIFNY